MDVHLPAKMIILAFCLGYLSSCVAAQKMVITHAPSYVVFQEQEQPLQTSEVSKVISHTLGVPSQSEMNWRGLLQGSMFKRPKANVLITMETSSESPALELRAKAEFPVTLDSPGADIEGLMTSLQGTFFDKSPLMLDAAADNNMFDVKSDLSVFRKQPNTLRRMSDRLLDRDSIAQQHNTGSLNTSMTPDLTLLGELQMIQDVLDTVKTDEAMINSPTPDLYSFTIQGLRRVAEKHGPTSPQASDASQLVTDFLHQVTDQFQTLYKNNVVVEILMVSPPQGLTRKVRSLMADEKNSTYNLAQDYDENYPVVFNIILWTMILLAIAVYGICYAIWNMDPGRDSIIYRMTTTRLKKD